MNYRVKVACINWSYRDAPHAMTYLLQGGEMVCNWYWPTWGDAMAQANELARRVPRNLREPA